MENIPLRGDEYFNELNEKYRGCMNEIKLRVHVIEGFINSDWHAHYLISTAESIALQFRKTLELIALASLVANREEYAKQRASFRTDWKADKIIEVLKEVNPWFYPDPVTPEHLANGDVSSLRQKSESEEYLTKDDYTLLLNKCSDLLHATNPYAPTKKTYKRFLDEAPRWARKIVSLLEYHFVHSIKSGEVLFLVEMNGIDHPVGLITLEKKDSSRN